MSGVNLTINGKRVIAAEGQMVLQASREAGFDIPTMCQHDALEPFGACRLCVVEVGWGEGRSKVVASCLYPVEEGLVVETETEKIVKYRRVILEMMHARWPLIDKELLDRYEVRTDKMVSEPTFCIMCGLCVRHCTEGQKSHVLTFVGRGVERQVVSQGPKSKELCPDCFSGDKSCLEVCPTGVIVNDNAVPCPATRKCNALAQPVRARDDENSRKVRKSIGE